MGFLTLKNFHFGPVVPEISPRFQSTQTYVIFGDKIFGIGSLTKTLRKEWILAKAGSGAVSQLAGIKVGKNHPNLRQLRKPVSYKYH